MRSPVCWIGSSGIIQDRKCRRNEVVCRREIHTESGSWRDSERNEKNSRVVCSPISSYIRANFDTQSNQVRVQTSIVALHAVNSELQQIKKISIIALLHIAELEYYENVGRIANSTEQVYCELIASDSLLTKSRTFNGTHSYLKHNVLPPLAVSRLAQSHKLESQLNCLDIYSYGWRIADYTSEQIESLKRNIKSSNVKDEENSVPKGILSLVSYTLLWFLPAPEVSALLLNWAQRGSGKPATLMTLGMLNALKRADLTALRRLAFAELLLSEQRRGSTDPIVIARNQCAVDVIESRNLQRNNDLDTESEIALLYGAMHVPDLIRRLVLDSNLYEIVDIQWLDAFKVDTFESVYADAEQEKVRLNATGIVVLSAALGILFVVDAIDWLILVNTVIDSIADASYSYTQSFLGASAEKFESCVAFLSLYFVRHIALYASLSKWALDWNQRLFE
mmetsp:Transcript_8572/g.15510  ORF Transcript_8572/g.15510 Transcript_8572/m.15510 type:complete len:451 (-) Transcript_8572:1084-2436(-)